jgi:4-hydroxybenzoate polyprenyltransferase
MSFESIKAYLDLMRLHFSIVWPLLFCSGLFLSFSQYGGFSWTLVIKSVLIALFGFEAGFILNDYVDVELDKREVDFELTNYWRPFGSRPLVSGIISQNQALFLFVLFAGISIALIFTLPTPNSFYVFSLMIYAYVMEYYYQIKKRKQNFPFAQLIGRTDFAFFPVAGYLVNGRPDMYALAYFLFFYPFAQVHLGINDIIDFTNDKVRDLQTIPILYGVFNTKKWIQGFTLLHIIGAGLFFNVIGGVLKYTFFVGFFLLIIVNVLIQKGSSAKEWLSALPVFHLTLFVYMTSFIANYFIT